MGSVTRNHLAEGGRMMDTDWVPPIPPDMKIARGSTRKHYDIVSLISAIKKTEVELQ
jgi:hypothetical protein